ncbi:helix-turn-helix domain-containing protein [[Leptolyngbya] sp. PCC 7376]|uniref:helix-turn-helix domain-containing protein n=1 Tax=[Leptolyngbya] sp. PCC 7376 TaxID=111781 RepID=UPI00059F41D2|nr:helix-turn-helix domain-containing protein [[Leptolyngbya] sp. PCC 7376]
MTQQIQAAVDPKLSKCSSGRIVLEGGEKSISRLKMPVADSDDLRRKALAAVALGIPKKDVCEMFGLGLNSLYLWIQRIVGKEWVKTE